MIITVKDAKGIPRLTKMAKEEADSYVHDTILKVIPKEHFAYSIPQLAGSFLLGVETNSSDIDVAVTVLPNVFDIILDGIVEGTIGSYADNYEIKPNEAGFVQLKTYSSKLNRVINVFFFNDRRKHDEWLNLFETLKTTSLGLTDEK